MVALILYGGVSPFLDDGADKLATFAQLMTSLTLFCAILLEVGALSEVPGLDAIITNVMVALNVLVFVFNMFSELDDDEMNGKLAGPMASVQHLLGCDDGPPTSPSGRQGVLDGLTETMVVPRGMSDSVLEALIASRHEAVA